MQKKESPGGNQGNISGQKNGTKVTQKRQIIKAFLSVSGKTMLMVSKETGIERANICRYVAKLKKARQIRLLFFQFCKISKHKSGYYSTDSRFLEGGQK